MSGAPILQVSGLGKRFGGFIALADSLACVGTVTNLATTVGVTVGDLIDRIQGMVGRSLPVIETEDRKRPAASEVFTLLGSAKLAGEPNIARCA